MRKWFFSNVYNNTSFFCSLLLCCNTVALGDAQVTPLSAEIMARAYMAKYTTHSQFQEHQVWSTFWTNKISPFFWRSVYPQVRPIWNVSESPTPFNGSAIVGRISSKLQYQNIIYCLFRLFHKNFVCLKSGDTHLFLPSQVRTFHHLVNSTLTSVWEENDLHKNKCTIFWRREWSISIVMGPVNDQVVVLRWMPSVMRDTTNF